ncbi:MAG: hypothetical protein MI861_12410 [Pirellulales bacterium]|nr:hypothetical protein [Pirellulales bacterium]
MRHLACFLAVWMILVTASSGRAEQPKSNPDNLARERLVAWCIVPFDANKRSPAERAEMIQRLGMRRVAYDWRQAHVPTFEEEIKQYKKRGIEFFAFWSWHDSLEPLIQKHEIQPQIWRMFASPQSGTQLEKVRAAATSLLPLVNKTKQLGLKLGLYNHGGWSGEPANMVAVCKYLREHHQARHVGIVYNFHHGHAHIENFETALSAMMPYLLCVNLNGMVSAEELDKSKGTKKIVTIGEGAHEQNMIKTLIRMDYQGPVGILDHRAHLDAEESLRLNLDGLDTMLAAP